MIYLYGGVLLLIAGLFGWASWERGEAIRYGQRAVAAEALVEARGREINALNRLQEQTAARVARGNQIRRDINAATNGTACAASGPVRAVLVGLRRPSTAAGAQPSNDRVPGAAARP